MSDLLDVPRSSYAKWELGKSVPDIQALVNIGNKLNIDWTSLVKETIVGEPLDPKLSETDLLDIYANEILKLSEKIRKQNAKRK